MQRQVVLIAALVCGCLSNVQARSDVSGVQEIIDVKVQLDDLGPQQQRAIAVATDVMHAYMAAFNARDPARWADTLLFPHVRISSGGVIVHPARDEFVAQMDFAAFARRSNWQRSAWDHLEVIQVGPNKVHIAVQFTRYDPQQVPIASFDSLYVLQPDDSGKWGIRARSSFAP